MSTCDHICRECGQVKNCQHCHPWQLPTDRARIAELEAEIATAAGRLPDPDSAAGMHGFEIANTSARIIAALQAADWISADVENEDLSDACGIIADVIAAGALKPKRPTE